MKYSELGVPILRDTTIEQIAEDSLKQFDPEAFEKPTNLQIDLALDWVCSKYEVKDT